ncbi:hypothetical protein HZH66_013749 [Vespula vulgaris]|uniref:Uncharacterized protein n=1 Tax=Vespula vulgaris TaxID=7454 RepID=A0A834J4I7_VESVU|nr:hypothetical protein HZH66_013749 [Vespula vulgaris]
MGRRHGSPRPRRRRSWEEQPILIPPFIEELRTGMGRAKNESNGRMVFAGDTRILSLSIFRYTDKKIELGVGNEAEGIRRSKFGKLIPSSSLPSPLSLRV